MMASEVICVRHREGLLKRRSLSHLFWCAFLVTGAAGRAFTVVAGTASRTLETTATEALASGAAVAFTLAAGTDAGALFGAARTGEARAPASRDTLRRRWANMEDEKRFIITSREPCDNFAMMDVALSLPVCRSPLSEEGRFDHNLRRRRNQAAEVVVVL